MMIRTAVDTPKKTTQTKQKDKLFTLTKEDRGSIDSKKKWSLPKTLNSSRKRRR